MYAINNQKIIIIIKKLNNNGLGDENSTENEASESVANGFLKYYDHIKS